MRKFWLLILEIVLLLSVCCTSVSAAEYEADCFEDLKKAFADKSGEDVTIYATEDIDWGGFCLTAKKGITYHISGGEDLVLKRVVFDGDGTVNIQAARLEETKGQALMASGNVTVNVCADLIGKNTGLLCTDNSSVTVTGNVGGSDGVQVQNNGATTIYGNINSPNLAVFAVDQGKISIIGNISSGGCALSANHDSEVIVEGNIDSTYGEGVSAWDNAKATVTGDISAAKCGVFSHRCSSVIVNGNVISRISDCVSAGDNACVTINGNVTGGNGNPKFKNEQNGCRGIGAGGNATVTVIGNVTGGTGYSPNGRGGYGILADGESAITVTGNVTGGNVDTGSASTEEITASSGDGLCMINSATVSVSGDISGGGVVSGQGFGGRGIHVRMRYASLAGGKLTVTGTAKGTTGGIDLYFANELDTDPPESCFPEIELDTCGEADGEGFSDDALEKILSSVTIHNKVIREETTNPKAFSIIDFFRSFLSR